MIITNRLSKETLKRYLLNFVMFIIFIGVTASSLYFIYVPGGYQGGRNPRYNMAIIFTREIWEEIHVWTSMIFSAVLLIHILLHAKWIKGVFFKYIQLWKKSVRTGNKLRLLNILNDGISAAFFILCLFSGLVLFFIPGGRGTATIKFLSITRDAWKGIHTWTGIGMLIGITLHLIIHWGWIKKVSKKFFGKPNTNLLPGRKVQQL